MKISAQARIYWLTSVASEENSSFFADFTECVVTENIHTPPPTEGIGNSGGVGGSKA